MSNPTNDPISEIIIKSRKDYQNFTDGKWDYNGLAPFQITHQAIEKLLIKAVDEYHKEITANETRVWITKERFDRLLILSKLEEVKLFSISRDEYITEEYKAGRIIDLQDQLNKLEGK